VLDRPLQYLRFKINGLRVQFEWRKRPSRISKLSFRFARFFSNALGDAWAVFQTSVSGTARAHRAFGD
jgi:hypothetical protein